MNANERAAQRRFLRRVTGWLRVSAVLALVFAIAWIVGASLKWT
jgi:hypothetical protein